MRYLSNEIQRDGTSQLHRQHEALSADYVKVDEHTAEENLEYFFNLAQHIVYHNEKNIAEGHWQAFLAEFKDNDTVQTNLEEWAKNSNTKPHQTLLVIYCKLLEYAVEDMNSLGQKHLDFFYNRVLRIQRSDVQADQVHLLFELAKNAATHKLDEQTLLDAGKKADGSPDYYSLSKEIVLNQVRIKALKSLYIETDHDFKPVAAPVANTLDGMGTAFDKPNAHWSAFGENQKEKTGAQRTMHNASLGFAIASPALWLQEGERTIALTFTGTTKSAEGEKPVKHAFKAYISGKNEWIPVSITEGLLASAVAPEDPASDEAIYPATMTLVLKLSGQQGEAMAYNDAILGEGYNTPYPVLKIELNHDTNPYPYKYLRHFEVEKIDIDTSVTGLKNIKLQTEQGPVPVGKPFMPFGPVPRKGAAFSIASNELNVKHVDSMNISLQWDGLPAESLSAHYSDYIDDTRGLTNEMFQADVSVYKENNWASTTQKSLFDSTTASKEKQISLNRGFATDVQSDIKMAASPPPGKQWNNAVKIEITGVYGPFGAKISDIQAFGHQEYTGLYTNAAIKKARDGENTASFPNSPYTPLLKEVSIGYTAHDKISLADGANLDQYFRILPFGIQEIKDSKKYALLSAYTQKGNFYIGLEGLTPPQNVSILFHVAEGSGKIDPATKTENIQWSFLTGGGWKSLSSVEIITDTTRDLKRTGIIEFSLGREAVKGGSLFLNEPDYYWIRGSIESKPRQISKLIALYPNAAVATHVIEPGKDENIQLPEGSITKLVNKQAAIKKVHQPFVSFNGRGEESDISYFTRVSERLRHKQRPVTIWDCERLVLQQFPQVYKVKTLKHADLESNLAPGNITLLIISNLRNQNAVNPLEPTTDYNTLLDIQAYVGRFVSSFIGVHAENPTYEKLLTDFKVGFHEGYDGGYYGNLLNEEIKTFLSPWAYKEGEDIIFGGKIYRSDILTFVENLEYVDFVTEFKLYHIHEGPSRGGIGDMKVEDDLVVRDYGGPGIGRMQIGADFVVGYESEIAEATTPRSILVSEEQHRIQVLQPDDYTCKGNIYDGIGFMAIEINFDVK